jgi:hypothetical protein
MLADPALAHVNFDISWDEVAKYAVATPETAARIATLLNKYPNRFLFGTDTVAPSGPAPYFAVFDMWAPVFRQLTPEASFKSQGQLHSGSSTRASSVRAWEKANGS